MRSKSGADLVKRRGGRVSITIITCAPSLSRQRGQFWKGDRAAELETEKRQDGQVKYDNGDPPL